MISNTIMIFDTKPVKIGFVSNLKICIPLLSFLVIVSGGYAVLWQTGAYRYKHKSNSRFLQGTRHIIYAEMDKKNKSMAAG